MCTLLGHQCKNSHAIMSPQKDLRPSSEQLCLADALRRDTSCGICRLWVWLCRRGHKSSKPSGHLHKRRAPDLQAGPGTDSSQSLGHLLSLLVWRTFDFAWPCYLPCRHMSQVNKDCTAVQVGLWLATRASCNQLHVLCCIPLESMQRGLVRGERPTERAWHGCQSCGFCAARSR